MSWLGRTTVFTALILVSVWSWAAKQDEVELILSLLDGIRSENPEVSQEARRDLMGIDDETLTDEGITVLIDAATDSTAAVQEAVVSKLFNVRDSHGRVVLEELYDTPAEVVKKTRPRYPVGARRRRIQGRVVLEFMVDSSGHVKNVRILRSIPPLDEAAVDCVRDWSFTPALRKGKSVPCIMSVEIEFYL